MTTKRKVYTIRLPLTLKEWKKGGRYVLTKLTTAEVQIVYHRMEHGPDRVTTKTHKVLNVKSKVPYIIRKLIPDSACVVDEFSTSIDSVMVTQTDPSGNRESEQIYKIETKLKDPSGAVEEMNVVAAGVVSPEAIEPGAEMLENIDKNEQAGGKGQENGEIQREKIEKEGADREPVECVHEIAVKEAAAIEGLMNICTTVYKNRYFDPNTFSLEIKTIAKSHYEKNVFKFEEDYKEVDIDFRTYNKSDMTKIGDRDYSGNWEERYPSTVVCKALEVTVNSFGLGWVAGEVDRLMCNLLVMVQQKILETYDEWINMSEEELIKLEKEMIKKFTVKVE